MSSNSKNGKNSNNNNINNNNNNNNNNNINNKVLRRKTSLEICNNMNRSEMPSILSQSKSICVSPHNNHNNCHTRRAVKQALMQQQRRRRRNTNTNSFALQSNDLQSKQTIITNKSVNLNLNLINGVTVSAVKQRQFINDMKDETIRNNYISNVDQHVNKLLEGVKPKRRGKAKSSQGSQIAELREGRVDLTSPDSILVHTNLRSLLNKHTFVSLPLYYQYKLVQILPKFDQVVTPEGWIKPSSSALSHEFFAKSCQSWLERLSDSKLTLESQQRRKIEIEKEKSKLDPWKVKNFEPIWGQTLESQRDTNNEYERIPKFGPSNSNSSQQSVRRNNLYSNKTFKSFRKLKPILKKSRINTDSNSTDNSISNILSEKDNNPSEATEQQVIVDDLIDNSLTTHSNDCSESLVSNDSPVFVKKVKIQTETEPLPTIDDRIIPKVHTVVLPSTPSSSSSKSLNKSDISVKNDENDSIKVKRLTRKRNAPTNVNEEGVDEERSFLICRRALESSPNNKLFYVSTCRRIHTVDTPSNTTTGSDSPHNDSENSDDKQYIESSSSSSNSNSTVPSSDNVVSICPIVQDNKSSTISTIQWAPSATQTLPSVISNELVTNTINNKKQKIKKTNSEQQNSCHKTIDSMSANSECNSIQTIRTEVNQFSDSETSINNSNEEREQVTIYNNTGDLTAFTSSIGVSCDNNRTERDIDDYEGSASASEEEPNEIHSDNLISQTDVSFQIFFLIFFKCLIEII